MSTIGFNPCPLNHHLSIGNREGKIDNKIQIHNLLVEKIPSRYPCCVA